MPHDHHHHHHHHHDTATMGDRRLGWAIAINLGLTVVQIVGGLAAGSLALVADALHNLSDAASLILALVARRFARRPSGPGMTFGHGRVEVVAALVNLTALAMLAFYLALEGLARLAAPEPVDGWPVIWIAALALAVDAGTALVTRAMAKESVNIRAAYLHNLADALGSIAVMVAGAAVLLFGWTWVDPAVTLMIAGYLMWQVKGEAGPVLRILLLASPARLDAETVARDIEAVEGVRGVHALRLWSPDERRTALDAHLVLDEGARPGEGEIGRAVAGMLHERHGIAAVTVQTACDAAACADAPRFGLSPV